MENAEVFRRLVTYINDLSRAALNPLEELRLREDQYPENLVRDVQELVLYVISIG